jgi:archaellin
MSDVIIAALISAALAAAASITVAVIQHRKSVALIEYRLQQLEKKVDIHNNVIERTYKLEEHVAVSEERFKSFNDRIEDLEKSRS